AATERSPASSTIPSSSPSTWKGISGSRTATTTGCPASAGRGNSCAYSSEHPASSRKHQGVPPLMLDASCLMLIQRHGRNSAVPRPGHEAQDSDEERRPQDGPDQGKRLVVNRDDEQFGKAQSSRNPCPEQGADEPQCDRNQAAPPRVSR